MKKFLLRSAIVSALVASSFLSLAADPPNFAGEYADKKFMKGQGVVQLSLEQTGNKVSIFFTGVRNDGQGAAPEVNATGNVTSKGVVEFKFQDDLKNSGTGTITRAGDDVLVSIKPTRVAEPRAMPFYGEKMRLKRVKK